jgi:hypothetical protein
MFAEVLQPMVDNFEALQPEVVQCSVCYRNWAAGHHRF